MQSGDLHVPVSIQLFQNAHHVFEVMNNFLLPEKTAKDILDAIRNIT